MKSSNRLLRSCSGRDIHCLQLSSGVTHEVLGISSSSRFLTHPQLPLRWVPFHKELAKGYPQMWSFSPFNWGIGMTDKDSIVSNCFLDLKLKK